MKNKSKLFSYILTGLFFLFIIIFLTNEMSIEDDYFWHLNTGKFILDNGFPATDIFNWVHPQHEWIATSWLWDVTVYTLYSWFGYGSLSILSAVLFIIIFILLYRLLHKFKIHENLIILFLLLLIFAVFERITPRPHAITYLFTVILLYIICSYKYFDNKDKRIFYFIPLIFLLWINFHAGFIIGLLILFILIIDIIIHKIRKTDVYPHSLNFYLLILFISIIVIFLNPYGFNYVSYFFRSFEAESIYKIGEWVSPLNKDISERFYIIMYYLLFFGGAAALYYGYKQKDLFIMLLMLALMINSLRAVRYTADYEFAAFIFIALGLNYLINIIEIKSIKNYITHGNDIKIVLSALLIFLIYLAVTNKLYYSYLQYNRTFGTGIDERFYPMSCMKFINDNKLGDRNTRIFNTYESGGLLTWETGLNNFVDSRASNFYMLEEFDTLYNKVLFYQNKLEYYNFDMIVYFDPYIRFDPQYMKDKLYSEFADFSEIWKLVYWDDATALFMKNDPKNQNIISKYEYKYVKPYSFVFEKNVLYDGYMNDRNKFMQEIERRKAEDPNSIYLNAIIQDYVK